MSLVSLLNLSLVYKHKDLKNVFKIPIKSNKMLKKYKYVAFGHYFFFTF